MSGIERIAAERARQIEVEGWSAAHDNASGGNLREAAVCYVFGRSDWWPWAMEWWKPSTDPIRNLEKAGALIAAEIDRLERAAAVKANQDAIKEIEGRFAASREEGKQ